MRVRSSVLGLVATLFLGCGPSDGFGPDATWSVIVYGHGDHNLSPALVRDVDEMKAATLRGNVDVLIFADWNGSEPGFATGGQWLRIVDGRAEVIETVPEPDLDEPGTLTAAVEHGLALAPADRHALILWNHGGAWEGGFGGDEADGSVRGRGIMMPAAAAAIRTGLDQVGVERLDFMAFDTCLQGGAESAAEFVGIADLYIGNGELDYGDGLDYRSLLTYLSDDPGTPIRDLAEADAAAYTEHHGAMLIDRQLRAHVALDLQRMPDVMERARDLVSSVDTPGEALDVARAMFAASPGYYNVAFSPEGSRQPGLHDIGQVADVLAGSSAGDVAGAARSMRDSLNGLILADSLGDLRTDAQVGMNVELTPAIDATSARLAEYAAKAPAWNQATGWSSLIEAVATFGDNIAPQVSGGVTPRGDAIEFQVFDGDVADVTFELGDVFDGVEYGYGWVTSATVPAGQTFEMTWAGEVWAMTTTSGFEAVYVAPWAMSYAPDGSPKPGMMFTPGIIEGGDEELAMLMFDERTGAAPVFTIWNPALDTWTSKAVEEYRDRTFRPIIPTWDQSGTSNVIRLGGISIGAGGLTLQQGTMNPGTYRLNLIAGDVWGNASMLPIDMSIGSGVAKRRLIARPVRDAWLRPLVAAARAGRLASVGSAGGLRPAPTKAVRPIRPSTGIVRAQLVR